MKLLTALAPAVLLVGLMGCSSYGSKWEAEVACNDWAGEEIIETYNYEVRYVKKSLEIGSRSCYGEDETRQVIGSQDVLDGGYNKDQTKLRDEIVKRYRW